ncbi:hypothetical protein [Actinokineospora enzanensis]|nr:hypothetical protein [Actinokineospora enzanensis]
MSGSTDEIFALIDGINGLIARFDQALNGLEETLSDAETRITALIRET